MKRIVVSGGFDPVHIGHLRMFERAKQLGDHLNVILNSDQFLLKKKGYKFMDFQERREIILGFECVDEVTESVDKDETVCKTIEMLAKKNEIDVFANGGDREKANDLPEAKICEENNIQMVFGIGGEKIQSSSILTNSFLNYNEKRPWGIFENIHTDESFLVKRLVVNPGEKLSSQFHNHREEYWIVVKGKGKVTISEKIFDAKIGSTFHIKEKEIHRLENSGKDPLVIIEVQIGDFISEEDIIRLDDEYGRVK